MDDPTGSITCWISSFQQGDNQAAKQLWETYAQQLTSFARKQMRGVKHPEYDEEDAVSSAFYSAFVALQNQDKTGNMNRGEFWRYVATITARKIGRQFKRNNAQKRNSIPFPGQQSSHASYEIDSSQDADAQAPDLLAEFTDQFRHLMEMLPRDDLRVIVGLKMEGYTNREIAQKIDRGISSVERKLKAIREFWESSLLTGDE